VTLSSHTTALIGCVNPGGQLSPSKGVQSEETQSQSVKIKPKDGKIKGSLTSDPPTFPLVLGVCPNNNWHTSILSLTYENVVMVIQQKNSEILKFNFGNIPYKGITGGSRGMNLEFQMDNNFVKFSFC
jgi:hypothetical protein